MLEGPIPATRKILERNSMSINDIDLFEVNEAFASVIAAWSRELGPTWTGSMSTVARSHSGTRSAPPAPALITTLLHELERSDKEIGLVTMCCGGGLGTATLIQRV